MMTFGEKIRNARKAKKLTQKQLAQKIGAAHNSISDWENNKNKPDPNTIEFLCGVLDITPNYLLAMSEEDFSPFEKLLIKKYRRLDEAGKEILELILDKELSRTEEIDNQQEQIELLKQRIATQLVSRIVLPLYRKFASAGSGEYLFDDIPTETIEVADTPAARKADFVIGVSGKSMEPDFYDGENVFVEKAAELNIGDVGIFVKGNECFIKELGADRLISRNKAYADITGDENVRLIGKVIGKVEDNL